MKNLNAVYEKFYGQIYAFVRKRVNNDEDALDISQEIFIKLQTKHNEIRDQKSLVPWLYRVARNQIIDFYRSKKYHHQEFSEELDLNDQLIDEDNEALKEVASWLAFFINIMKDEDREILELVELQGKTQKEAAQILNIKTDAAKARHQRAKKRLKDNLEKCCQYSFDARGKIIDYKLKDDQDDCCH